MPHRTHIREKASNDPRKQIPEFPSYKNFSEIFQLSGPLDLCADIASLQEVVAAPGFYAQDKDVVQQTLRELGDAETLLERCIERWGELETLRESFPA